MDRNRPDRSTDPIPEPGPDDIREILRIFAESDMEDLRLEVGATRLHLSKRSGGLGPDADARTTSAAPAPPEASAAPEVESEPRASEPTEPPPDVAPPGATGLVELRSPVLGVFYRRPAPSDPAFVEVGSVVEADDDVCIVDVMKLFTRVPAGTAGRIAEICVEDGDLVEHGQVLMRIEPA